MFDEPDPEPRLGSRVQLYDSGLWEADGWFHQGEVVNVQQGCAEVDFGDWIEVWPLDDLIMQHVGFMRFALVPATRGRIIKDFRQPAAAP